MNLDDKLTDMYHQWLLDEYADEIHNKDQYEEALDNHLHIETFIEEVKDALETL